MANPTLPARRTKSAAAAAAHDAEDRSHAKTEAQAESAGAAETTTGGGAVEEITTVSRACAFGDAARLRELVAASGSQSVCAPDAEGYYPLQWASLNDQAAMVELLIEEFHVDVNARDAGTGQAAMHWAATRGCERAVIALAERGANLATRDGRGYTPAHVAAQYGQTRLLYFMHVRYGVDVCGPLDDDGRSPLHWSAYKGHGDVTRLLIFLGADVRGRDRERCTPLHWAAVMGQGHICHIILQAASAPLFGRDDDADASSALDESDDLSPLAAEAHDAKGARVWGAGGRGRGGMFGLHRRRRDGRIPLLRAKDATGSDAIALAQDKGHAFVASQLQHQLKESTSRANRSAILIALTKYQFGPLLALIIALMLFWFAHFVVFLGPEGMQVPMTASSAFACACVLGAGVCGLGFMYRAATMDPGYVTPNTGGKERMRTRRVCSSMGPPWPPYLPSSLPPYLRPMNLTHIPYSNHPAFPR